MADLEQAACAECFLARHRARGVRLFRGAGTQGRMSDVRVEHDLASSRRARHPQLQEQRSALLLIQLVEHIQCCASRQLGSENSARSLCFRYLVRAVHERVSLRLPRVELRELVRLVCRREERQAVAAAPKKTVIITQLQRVPRTGSLPLVSAGRDETLVTVGDLDFLRL